MRAAAAGLFLVAALASMACSNNALMNPQPSQGAQGGQVANSSGGQLQNPGGQLQNP
jgi:hypothetical protein